jgi:hypothetical protein
MRLTPGALWLQLQQRFGHGLRVAYYRDVVRRRILSTPPISGTTDERCEIHVLTSKDDWLNLLWTLHSFYRASQRRYALCIHDDGTLSANAAAQLQAAFPQARLVLRHESDIHLAKLLAHYPRCLKLRATNILALKLLDFVAFLRTDRMMLLDSDILFFEHPKRLVGAIDDRAFTRNTLNRNWGYGYSIDVEKTPLDFHLPAMINSGLGLIHRASIRYDWIEDFLALPGILSHPHRIEQTLFALCSARFGYEMLPSEYDVHLGPTNRGVPCRHYTGPARHLMYSEGMRRLVRAGFLRAPAIA